MPLFNNQVSTPALANIHNSQHTENVGTSTSNQLKSVNYSIGDQTTTMNKNNYYIEDVQHLNISDEDIIKLMELKDKNFDEYQKQVYALSLVYRIKVREIKYMLNERFKQLNKLFNQTKILQQTPFYKSPTFPQHNIEQSPHGIIEGNYQITNPMPLFDNQNLYRNNLISQQLNLNQFIGGNNHNTEINYLNNSIDSANNELMKVVESSKVSLQFPYSDFPTYRLLGKHGFSRNGNPKFEPVLDLIYVKTL
uniref:Uncharacterized protein n=1 Tax=Meloidogyne enterolobii TaxID=390850 RepID=A0A6V7WA91_MELEN|nr:unnamed protein product [Meloidogyne enterolobii]